MSKPGPKSNLIQTMLIFAVIFLGMQLLMPKGNQKDKVDPKIAYEKAIAGKKTDEISKASLDYAKSLRDKETKDPTELARNIEQAKKLEFDTALLQKNDAISKRDFNEALNAYNEFHKLKAE